MKSEIIKEDNFKFKIDWVNYWNLKAKASLFELALLSLGYNPEYADLIYIPNKSKKIEWEPQYIYHLDWYVDGEGIITRDYEIIKRMYLILDNAKLGEYYDSDEYERIGQISEFDEFDLKRFAKWAHKNNWNIPDELREIGLGGVKISISSTSNVKENLKPRELVEVKQKKTILDLIIELGHDPMKIPPRPPGKKWIKLEIKNQAITLFPSYFTEATFNKTWQKLRNEGYLKELSSTIKGIHQKG